MSVDPVRVQECFLKIVNLEGAEQSASLEEFCGQDADLKKRVQALLRAHSEPDSYLDAPYDQFDVTANLSGVHAANGAGMKLTSGAVGSAKSGKAEQPTAFLRRDGFVGTVIAERYTLHEKIGEGGMGEVWVAKQTEPVKRKVAIKLIRAGMDSKAMLQRFEHERQALAMMDHPNIAHVLDGGATPSGQPFLVMELVNGLPLNKFCDEARLEPKARLELFVSVCQAVQHAHQKGIVHRDLKPANILVTMIDGKPVPKVIDFGVAKATAGKLLEDTIDTQFGAVVGTLEYMSPEQAGFAHGDIDTRADIYSLGVILYELLTGLRPIDAAKLRKVAMTEMIRIIREEEPSRPSTRLSTNESLPSVAASRHIDPKKLMAMLHGELDWVVMKCLEKQRDRRYETANGLARDIQRFLANEPVEARPPSRLYRMSKFVSRNRGLVASIALVTLCTCVGAVAFAWQARIARQQRDLAVAAEKSEKSLRNLAEQQEQIAREQSSRAQKAELAERSRADELKKVVDFQSAMLGDVDVHLAGKKLTDDVRMQLDKALAASSLSVEEQLALQQQFRRAWKMLNVTDASRRLIDETILGPSVAAIDKQFVEQPLVDARLRQTLATSYKYYSLYAKALPLQLRALEIRQRELGEANEDTIYSIGQTSMLYWMQGQNELAASYAKREVELAEKYLGDEIVGTADAYNHYSLVLQSLSQQKDVEKYLREALRIRKKVQGEKSYDRITAEVNLAIWLAKNGKLQEALESMERMVESVSKYLPPSYAEHADVRRVYGLILFEAGELEKARMVLNEAYEKAVDLMGVEDRITLLILRLLADVELADGNLAAAEERNLELLEACQRVFSAEESISLRSRNRLVVIRMRQGRLEEANALAMELNTIYKSSLEVSERDKLTLRRTMASLFNAQGKYADALQILGGTEEEFKDVFANEGVAFTALFDLVLGQSRLGLAKTDADFANAEKYLQEAIAKLEGQANPYKYEKRQCHAALAELYSSWNAVTPDKSYDEKARQWNEKMSVK